MKTRWPYFLVFFFFNIHFWIWNTQNSFLRGPFWSVKYLSFWQKATDSDSSSYVYIILKVYIRFRLPVAKYPYFSSSSLIIKEMTTYFILTPLKLSLNPRYKEGNIFLTYLCSDLLQHVFNCSKSSKKCQKMCWTWTGYFYFQIENEVLGPVPEYYIIMESNYIRILSEYYIYIIRYIIYYIFLYIIYNIYYILYNIIYYILFIYYQNIIYHVVKYSRS